MCPSERAAGCGLLVGGLNRSFLDIWVLDRTGGYDGWCEVICIHMNTFGETDRAGIFAASLVFFLRVITRLISIARLYAYIRYGGS